MPGTLHAWNASDLTQEIWNSNLQPADVLGSFAKFVSPLVANGRVYVPTFSNELAIYGTKSSAQGSSAAPQVASVLNGASFIQESVSPGEIVAIFGANVGPSTQLPAKNGTKGAVSNTLGNVQQLFDNVASPLLKVSASNVRTVVPFGVSGTTQMVLQTAAGQSSVASLPVVAATPALFTSSGLGSGQASALNQDGSVNSATNPATAGSVISLFATGLGQTSPNGVDGAIVGSALSTPNLPISANVGGLASEIVYAGAAPGMIDGTFQINVRLPLNVATGPVVLLVLQAGAAIGQTGVWISIQ